MSTALLFLSHKSTPSIRRAYNQLESAAGDADVYWLHDVTNVSAPASLKVPNLWPFSIELLNSALQYRAGIPQVVPGYAHAPVILFALRHPGYDTFWVIEYDVHFEGKWRRFFDSTANESADLLTTRVRTYRDEPDWDWWNSLHHPTKEIPLTERVASFNPIYRISRPALLHLHKAHLEGWTGHNEVLLATLLLDGGFRVADLNGTGPYGGQIADPLYSLRTMRWRPPQWHTPEPNMLHHPVKPLRELLKYHYRQYHRKGRQYLGRMRAVLKRLLTRNRPSKAELFE